MEDSERNQMKQEEFQADMQCIAIAQFPPCIGGNWAPHWVPNGTLPQTTPLPAPFGSMGSRLVKTCVHVCAVCCHGGAFQQSQAS